jgi:lysozyme
VEDRLRGRRNYADVMARRWWILLGAFVLFLALAMVGWFLWVPNWRPALKPGEVYGIDVSAHQGPIDWRLVAHDDISFAYIKATEGGDFVDERFSDNWAEADFAGLERGAYHFFTLCTPGATQADNFLRVAPPDESALPPAVDLELAGNCTDRPSATEVEQQLNVFVETIEDAWEREVVLYVGNDWEELYPTRRRLDRPLWIRRFVLRPSEDWTIWQLHGYARVDGMNGGVDLNVMSRDP